jgi:hypothetical protein
MEGAFGLATATGAVVVRGVDDENMVADPVEGEHACSSKTTLLHPIASSARRSTSGSHVRVKASSTT